MSRRRKNELADFLRPCIADLQEFAYESSEPGVDNLCSGRVHNIS